MKYLVLILIFLLTGCKNVEVTEPIEVIVDSDKEKAEVEEIKETEKIEEITPVVTKYPIKVKIETSDRSYTAVSQVEDFFIDNYEMTDGEILTENPFVLPTITLDDYIVDFSALVDGKKIYQKYLVYDNYEEYQAIKVKYKGDYFYAYYFENEIVYAKTDERGRVTVRYGFKPSYSEPVYVDNYISTNGIKAIYKEEELLNLIDAKSYYVDDKIYFNGDLTLNVTVSKDNSQAVAIKEMDQNTMRSLAESRISDYLAASKNGFKQFVEYKDGDLVGFDFTDLSGDLVIDLRPVIDFGNIPAYWYSGGAYYVDVDCYVEGSRTSNVKDKILKEVDDLEPGTTKSVLVQFKYEVYNDERDDVATGTYQKYVTVFCNE